MQKYPTKSSATSSGATKTHKVSNRMSYSHVKADARQRQKQDEAAERQLHYEALSIKDKLKTCVPGGSKRQRAKLEALLKLQQPEPEPVKKKTVDKSKKKEKISEQQRRDEKNGLYNDRVDVAN
jgi:hypothetical protein